MGANVQLKGSNRVLATDEKGEFHFPNLGDARSIVVTYVGYEPYEATLSRSQNFIRVVLRPKQQAIEEIPISTGIFNKADNSFTGASITLLPVQIHHHSFCGYGLFL